MPVSTPACLLPPDEAARVRSLHAYHLLHAPPERVFSELVALSAQVFELPVALLAIVDAEEVIYKVTHGVPPLRNYPRADTFCALAVQQNQSVILWDVAQASYEGLSEGARARVQASGMRFYAGAPLHMPDAHTLGALCVLGYAPRAFSAREQQVLEHLAEVLGLSIAARHVCLTRPGLGWAHWQVLEEQLATDVLTLMTFVQQQLALSDSSLTGSLCVLAQVAQRLEGLRDLLTEYQAARV